MTERKFQVGDRVRCEREEGWRGIAGTVMGYRGEWLIFCPDEGSRYPNGMVVKDFYRRPPYAGMEDADFDLIVPATDELAELRAFKEAALASGYVPLEPVDPDFEAANRIAVANDWMVWDQKNASGPMWEGSATKLVLDAIKWARANPR